MEWGLEVAGVGPLWGWAERRDGAIHAGFVLNGATQAASPAVSVPATPTAAPPPVPRSDGTDRIGCG